MSSCPQTQLTHMENMETVVGILSGSLGTIALTKLIEWLSAGRQHRQALARAYFERRLEIAEACVAYWQTSAVGLGIQAEIIESILTQGPEAPRSTALKQFYYAMQAQSTALQGSADDRHARRYPLFFDHGREEVERSDALVRRLVASIRNAEAKTASFSALHDAYHTASSEQERKTILPRLRAAWAQAQPYFQELLDAMRAYRTETLRSIDMTRAEFRRYES